MTDSSNASQHSSSSQRPNSPPLRVVIMSTQKAWHGGEAQAELLGQGLRQRGHSVGVLARENMPFATRMAAQGFETIAFAGRGRNLPAMWRIRAALKRLRPDVLFYNDSHSLAAGTIASLGLTLPARLAARRVDFPLRSTWAYLRGADRLICVSNAVAEICQSGGIQAERIRVVHDGVDPQRLESGDRARGRQSLGLAESDRLLLTVAKLTDHKGHIYLLRALPAILASHPRTIVALAGDGELRAALEAEAASLNVTDHVRFLGYRGDVPDLLRAADLFVAPSRLEGLNTSLIDAMLTARPIVTTTAGGIPDLVDTKCPAVGPNAWVVPPQDAEALAAAVIEAFTQPELAASFAEQARRRAMAHFTAEQMVAGTLAVIDEVLASRCRQVA